MTMSETELEVIEWLGRIEHTLSRLYQAYAGLFPAQADFWSRLASDELRHMDWVTGFLDNVKVGLLEENKQRTNLALYLEFYASLEAKIADAGKQPPSLLEALATAREAEQTYLERHLLKIFHTDVEGVQRVLDALVKDTERHWREVDRMWEKHRP